MKRLNFKIDFKKLDFMIHAKNMFGEMQKLFKDRKMVRFTLSAKFHWGNRKTTTISMEGERSANGAWRTWSPRDRDARAFESPELLREKFFRIEGAARSYIVENELESDWSPMEVKLREAMRSGLSVDALEYQAQIPVRAIAGYGYDAHLYAPLMATAYMIEGVEALADNNLEHASDCAGRGGYWSSREMLIPDPRHRFSGRASTGGHGKADKFYEPVKIKAAELLSELEPDGGWISSRDAVERVANELASKQHLPFIARCGLEYHNLPRTIERWFKAEPERFRLRLRSKA